MPTLPDRKEKQELQLYMAFPDGVLHYVCPECTLICCNRSDQFGGNLALELKPLVKLYPAMENAALRRRGDAVKFATPSGRCFFLNDEGRCHVEMEHGKEMKPQGCTIFPFNHLVRIGKVIAVGPNFLCLLRFEVPARPGQVEGTHSVIERNLRQSSYLSDSYIEGLPQARIAPSLSPTKTVKQEVEYRDTCSQSLGLESFAATLRKLSSDPDGFDAFVVWASKLLNYDLANWTAERDSTDDLFFTLSPTLRLGWLHLSQEVKLRMLALDFLLIRQLQRLPFGMKRSLNDVSSLKGAYEVLMQLNPALYLVSCADNEFIVPERVLKHIPKYGDPQLTFAAFTLLRAASQRGGLANALEKVLAPLTTSDRTALLIDLGKSIEVVSARKRRAKN